jgi:hypothetical protein
MQEVVMSYFSDFDISLKTHGIKRVTGPKCQCGRETSIIGFSAPHTLEVVCYNGGCKYCNERRFVGANEKRIR